MENRPLFQASGTAAVVAFVCVVAMAIMMLTSGVNPQPSTPSGPVSKFVEPINSHPRLALAFFALDSLFVLSYLTVFLGVYAVVAGQSRVLAWVGLGSGVAAAVLDATENAYFITYALLVINGVPLTQPALMLIYVLANLKWMAGFAAFVAFGFGWPREGRRGWAITGLMLLFPLVGVLGVALPGLIAWRGLFFLAGMALFAWDLLERARRA